MLHNLIDQRYRVAASLASSRGVSIYRADDLRTSAEVALKLVHASVADPDLADKLGHEFGLLSRLRHPNIVRVIDYGACPGTGHYFTMPLVRGTTLAGLSNSLSHGVYRAILLQLARALEYLSSNNIVHSDITPDNILIWTSLEALGHSDLMGPHAFLPSPRNVRATLIDFGMAHSIGTCEGNIPAGKLPFVPPELLNGAAANHRTDIYSLGMSISYALLGDVPGATETPRRLVPPPTLPFADHLDPILKSLLIRMIHPDPAARPLSAGEIVSELLSSATQQSEVETQEGYRSYFSTGEYRETDALVQTVNKCVQELIDPAPPELLRCPRIYLIGGEAGIGKSRIIERLRTSAQLHKIATVQIRCNPHGLDPLGPLEALRHFNGLPSDPPAVSRTTVAPRPEEPVPFWYLRFATKQAPPTSEGSSSTDRPTPEGLPRHRTRLYALHALAQDLRDVCRSRPLAIFFEDLHFADPETLELVRLLAVQPNGPLVVASYRNDTSLDSGLSSFLRYFCSSHNSIHHTIERKSADETLRYLLQMFSPTPIAPELADSLHSLAGGSPLLLEEALMGFVVSGYLSKSPGGWIIDERAIRAGGPPQTLRSFARSRLSSLDSRLKRILEILAVLDSPADVYTIRHITNRELSSLHPDLQALVSLGLIVRNVSAPGDRYAFRHRCIREVLYEDLETARRRSLHRQVAELIERSCSPIPDTLLEQLAFHFLEGMDFARGSEYAFRAAYIAMDHFATHRAIDLFVKGLNFLRPDQIERKFEGLQAVTALLWLVGDLPRAHKFCFEMLILARNAGALDKEALAIREMARILIESGDLIRGLAYAEEAERRFLSVNQCPGQTGAVILQAQAFLKMGALGRADELATRGYENSAKVGDMYGQSIARSVAGLIAIERGNNSLAVATYEEALHLATQMNDFNGVAVMLSNMGLAYLEQNLLDRARGFFERSLSEARERGLSLAATLASTNLGEIHRLQGELDRAEPLFREALTLADNSSRKYLAAYATYSLGFTMLLRGEFSEALEFLSRAEALDREAGGRGDQCTVLICKSELHQYCGQQVPAKETIQTALTIALEIGNPQTLAHARALTAIVQLDRGAADAKAYVKDEYLDEARTKGRTQGLARLLEARAAVGLAEGLAAEALDDIAEMKSIAKQSGLRPDLVRAALLEGQALLKLQRRNEARLVLEQGAFLAREIGLRPLLSHLLFWLSQAQESAGDAAAAADSLFEAADLINAMAAAITDEAMRQSYLEVPTNLAALQHAERLERAGMRRRTPAGDAARDPDTVAADAFDEITRRLGGDPSLRSLLTAALDRAIETIHADRGLLILLDPAGDESEQEVTIARNLEGETIQDATDYCRSILQEVSSGDSILAVDLPGDERFRARRSVTLYRILSLMCVPLRLGACVLGAIYFDSRSGDRLFRQDDLRLVEAFAVRVASAIAEAQEAQRLRERAVVVNRELAKRYHLDSLIGESPAMQRLFRMMEAVIRADCNVLVVGESGTGKELVARAIHYAGARKLCNFVPLDCGAIPETLIESELFGYKRGAFSGAEADKKGLLEEADGGTLFLDEITNTSTAFQAKLLRALQSGEIRRLGETVTRRVDARIIAASNADIDEAIRAGRFRDDLYYRLNVVTLSLPALRDRPEDIPLLAEHFARQLCEARGLPYQGIGAGAMARLQAYSWPGNVRELQHAIEAALVVSGGGMVRRDALPEKVLGGELEVVRDLLLVEQQQAGACGGVTPAPASGRAPGLTGPQQAGPAAACEEKVRVEKALIQAGGDKTRAARLLGWNRMRLYRRMKSLGIAYDVGKNPDEPAGSAVIRSPRDTRHE